MVDNNQLTAIQFVFAQPVADPTNKPQTGTYIVDISDLDNPVFFDRYEDGTVGLDHNFVVEDDKLIIASYTSGTRVLEIGRDGNNEVTLTPIAVMDTEPRLQENILNIKQEEKFSSAFLGQWGIYSFPNSDTIIASDINNGLVVIELSDEPCKGMKCSKRLILLARIARKRRISQGISPFQFMSM